MIEKLKTPKNINWDDTPENLIQRHLLITDAYEKTNELVDAVNDITDWIKRTDETIVKYGIKPIENGKISKMEKDPYAEQRKWIGCVCRFWYDNPDDTVLDYLGKIQMGKNGIEYYGKETYDWFPHCKPVKPDDDIIYKGGDNE